MWTRSAHHRKFPSHADPNGITQRAQQNTHKVKKYSKKDKSVNLIIHKMRIFVYP